MGEKYFIIYKSFYAPVKNLSDVDAGKLFKAIFDFQINRVEFFSDEKVKLAFSFFKTQFDIDNEKYEKKVKRNQENGQKGGRPKTKIEAKNDEKKPKKPSGLFFKHKTNPPGVISEHKKKPSGLFENPKNPVGYFLSTKPTPRGLYLSTKKNPVGYLENQENQPEKTGKSENPEHNNNDLINIYNKIKKTNMNVCTKKKDNVFEKPTKKEVVDLMASYSALKGMALNLDIEPDLFFMHYENCDWRLTNGKKLKSWEVACQKWVLNSTKFNKGGYIGANSTAIPAESKFDKNQRELREFRESIRGYKD